MRVTQKTFGAVLERLPQSINYRYYVSNYDADNLYPQRVEQVMFRSPITLSAVEAKADFIHGLGFQNNGDLVVNRAGKTLNQILREAVLDYSTFGGGMALHFNVNLLGEITEINNLDFKFARLGVPDEFGRHEDVKVNLNWEKNGQKLPQRNADMVWDYPLWSFNAELNQQRILEFESDFMNDFNGFIMYWTPKKDVYPRATFDSVLDSSQTQGEIQIFELANIQNGFLGASIFKHQGKINTEGERQAIINDLSAMKGAGNANSIMLIETPDDFTGQIIENIPANNQDTLMNQTNTNVVNRIIQSFGMPPSILGIMPESGMFNQQEIQDSYIYYNLRTENDRLILSELFNKIGQMFDTPFEVGSIMEKTFTADNSVQEEEIAVVSRRNGRTENNNES